MPAAARLVGRDLRAAPKDCSKPSDDKKQSCAVSPARRPTCRSGHRALPFGSAGHRPWRARSVRFPPAADNAGGAVGGRWQVDLAVRPAQPAPARDWPHQRATDWPRENHDAEKGSRPDRRNNRSRANRPVPRPRVPAPTNAPSVRRAARPEEAVGRGCRPRPWR